MPKKKPVVACPNCGSVDLQHSIDPEDGSTMGLSFCGGCRKVIQTPKADK